MEKTIKIGRDDSNDVIVNEPRVSRNHAVVTLLDDGSYEVKDLGSTNGTFINGRKIKREAINEGDRLQVAESIVNWDEILRCIRSSNNKATLSEKPHSKIKRTISIGSGADNEIVIDSPYVSKKHATISALKNGDYYIKDQGSSNGTFVNDTKVVAKNFKKTDFIRVANNRIPDNWFLHRGLKFGFWEDNKSTLLLSVFSLIFIGGIILSYLNRCEWFNYGCELTANEIYASKKNATVFIRHQYYYTVEINGKKYFVGKNKIFKVTEANTDSTQLLPYNEVAGSGSFIDKEGTILTSKYISNPWLNKDEVEKMYREVKESRTIAKLPRFDKLNVSGSTFNLSFLPNGIINNRQNYIEAIVGKTYVEPENAVGIIYSVKKDLPLNATAVSIKFNPERDPAFRYKSLYYNSTSFFYEGDILKDSFYFINTKVGDPPPMEGSVVLNERGELAGTFQNHQVIFLPAFYHQLTK